MEDDARFQEEIKCGEPALQLHPVPLISSPGQACSVRVMLGLLALIGGFFALIWSLVFASVGLALFAAFLIPLLIFCLIFRIGFALMRVAAVLVLLCFVAAWII